VSAAQGEWARTQHEDFRSKNDGEASVGGLEAVLFGAQAAAGELATPPSYQTQSGPNPALQMSPEAQIKAGQLQDAAAENRTVTNQPKYGRADNLGKKVNVGGGTESAGRVDQKINLTPAEEKAFAAQKHPGLIAVGNIDLTQRPRVDRADGNVSTTLSMSFEEDGTEILVPTVSPDGKLMSDDEAVALYHKKGKFLGKFKDAESADNYADGLHKIQAAALERGNGEKPATRGEYRTIAPEGKAKATAQIEAFVADNGTPAISMDTDQPAEIRKLRMGLAKTLGLDPRDPFVRGALTSALLKLRAGQLGGKRTRAAGKASGPSLGETVSHLHPGAGGM
jgi:hypothetical protein